MTYASGTLAALERPGCKSAVTACDSRVGFQEIEMLKRFISIALIFGSTVAVAAPPSKIAPDVPKSGARVEVIIRFDHPPTKDDLKQIGPYGQVKKSLDVINGIDISLPPAAIQLLQYIPGITYITPNRSLNGALDITTQTVAANLAWQFGYTGAGVGVAVIDSGITPRHDLTGPNGVTSRIVYSQNFVSTASDATDQYGHGTHVAGIIGSNGDDSTGPLFSRTFKGVAPGVNLIDLRVLDQNGSGQEVDVISAIQTAINLKSTYNIRVINLSLGRPVFESYTLDPLCQAVEAAWQAGIVVVTAAGNYGRDNSLGTHGYGTIASPGNDPYVITVGAMNSHGTPSPYDDTIASYSSKGPTAVDHIVKPDLVAPGNGVVSLLASTSATLYTMSTKTHVSMAYETNGLQTGTSTSYYKLSGTSMATPVVAGAVALLLQKNPSLTPDQVKARLMKTALKSIPSMSVALDSITFQSFSMLSDIFTVGAGYLNVNAALTNNDLATLPALSPLAVWDPASHHVVITRDFTKTWGNPIAFDDSVVWGDALFAGQLPNGLSIIFGQDDSVVWGDTTTAGFTVLWGSTVNIAVPLQATANDDDDQ